MTMTTAATATRRATLCDIFAISATERGVQGALRTTDGALAWSWSDYGERMRAAAAGLAGIGVGPGETVACWLTNRPEFHVADAAALHLGAAPFSIYPTFTAEQAEHVVGDAGARVLITEPQFLERAHAVRDGRRTSLETIVLVDGADARALTWEELEACARKGFDLAAASRAIGPDNLATLIYTSGTTGPPKGVELTHRNVVSLLEALADRLDFPTGARTVSWLPMAHIAERLCTHYFPMARGWEVTTCAEPRAVADVVRQVRPGVFFSPPRLWEKLRAGVLAAADQATRAEIESAIDRVRAGDGVQDGAVASAVRAELGFDELAVAIVGAAPCPSDVIEFWHALGVPLGEVYGLSETTGVATANSPLATRIGTAGTALRGVEVRLSDEGEVLVRGSVVFAGYRNLPEKTAEAIDADGWLHTGDVGVIDADGYLRIVDRIKELIINASGKNMSPANIEAAVKGAGGLVGQVCAIGDGRPFNVALLTLDAQAAAVFAAENDVDARSPAALAEHPRVQAEVRLQVTRGNERLARAEQIKAFAVLTNDWVAGGDELTPTMKLKRRPIAAKYAHEIERLYAETQRP